MRGHSVIGSPDKEPWAFGPKYEDVNRKTIDLRYEFLPYIYTTMCEASETGIPAMRPLCFVYPNDPSFTWNEDEFMFGDDLLVAPVLWPGDTTRELRLPAGEWYDFWSFKEYEGGQQVKVPAPIDRLPLFVRAGSTIPTQQVVQYTDEDPINPLTLTVFPSTSSSSRYYEDDGVSFAYESGEYLRRSFEERRTKNEMTLRITQAEGKYVPPKRSLVVRFVDVPREPRTVSVSGVPLKKGAWVYSSSVGTLTVKTEDTILERMIAIKF